MLNAKTLSVIDDVTAEDLLDDPYPVYDRIRAMASAVKVGAANLTLVTRFDDIHTVEKNTEIFTSTNPQSLMSRVMGHSLMRKDGRDHRKERNAIDPSFRPRMVKHHWSAVFEKIADDLISGFEQDGQVDLFDAFAAPMASLSLIEMLGLEDVDWRDMAVWSQALMDAVGNYTGDPEVFAAAERATDAIDAAVDAALPRHQADENPSILSSMLHAKDPQSRAQIRANVNVIIGGGLNEPRDAILTVLYGLLSHPDQLQDVLADPSLFATAFEEGMRWVSPLAMYPRRVACDTVLGDTALKEGEQIGICVGAANRDPSRFDNPHDFNIHRPKTSHLAFGAGPHFCAGTWVARQMVGEIAVPMLFRRLKNLRLDPAQPPKIRGWVFRGPISMPVIWDR